MSVEQVRPWDHPYESAVDDPTMCVNCGWQGSYAHKREFYEKWVWPAETTRKATEALGPLCVDCNDDGSTTQAVYLVKTMAGRQPRCAEHAQFYIGQGPDVYPVDPIDSLPLTNDSYPVGEATG